MGLFKKVTSAVTKPFKQLGNGWWNDVREPLVGGVAGAVTGALVAGPVGAFYGGMTGAGLGESVHQNGVMKDQAAQAAANAQRELQASYAQTLQSTATPAPSIQDAVTEQNNDTTRRRAYSMGRTVLPGSTLGRLGGRITLG